jgi:hypothetical protein
LEDRERAREVDRAALEVPGVRRPTSPAIAQTSPATAGESKTRVGSHKEEHVSAGVLVETTDDAKFMRGSSAEHVAIHEGPFR